MAFSASQLTERLGERPRLGSFRAGPLLIEVYEEDASLLPSMYELEGDEFTYQALLSVLWLAPLTNPDEKKLLSFYQGWASPLSPGLSLYVSTLLDLQLMLRGVDGPEATLGFDDYSVEGLLFLSSRMGLALAEEVKKMEHREGSGGKLFYRLPD